VGTAATVPGVSTVARESFRSARLNPTMATDSFLIHLQKQQNEYDLMLQAIKEVRKTVVL
jgi:hypothetical protein